MIRLDRFQCWQFSSVHTLVCFDPSRSSLLFGLPANSFLDQPLAQLPQGRCRRFALRLLRRQAAAAVVEVHPSQALQLCSRGAVHSCGRSLLLEFEKEQKKWDIEKKANNINIDKDRYFIIVILTAVLWSCVLWKRQWKSLRLTG